jgi:hypothetical protein
MNAGASPAARVALLSANRADAWCVGVAAHISRLATTWLHPLASLDDQIDQIEDCEAEILVIDVDAFLLRGGELAGKRQASATSSRWEAPNMASISSKERDPLTRRNTSSSLRNCR